jgi:hypothetical protein
MLGEPPRIKLVYVAGLGHSGTTLLGMILGQLHGFFYAGELAGSRAFERGGRCGCGQSLAECETWQSILRAAFPRPELVTRLALDPGDGSVGGLMRQLLTARSSRLDERKEAYALLLPAILHASGARVIVDSSKWPGYAYFLRHVDGVELAVVHLVRDPRGVAHSRRKRAERQRGVRQPSAVAGALLWDLWNPVIEALSRRGRYLRIRYDDLVSAPEQVVRRVAELMDEEPAPLRFTSARTVELRATHSVEGNRNRFQTGPVRIALDEAWRTPHGLSTADRGLVAALTWPIRRRYGYD